MKFNSTKLIYFSPTGTTRNIIEAIAQGIEPDTISAFDLTLPETNKPQVDISGRDLAIIGAPVYDGRIPSDARKRLEHIDGDGAAAILLATCGNREYEDALLELKDIAICS